MTRDEAQAILDKPRDEAVDIILALAEKADELKNLQSGLSNSIRLDKHRLNKNQKREDEERE